jgi:hypothetical protein
MMSFPKYCAHCSAKWSINHKCPSDWFQLELKRIFARAQAVQDALSLAERESPGVQPGPASLGHPKDDRTAQ